MAPGVDKVLSVLEDSGFERLPSPLVVAGSTFEFEAAARGTIYSHDLVVVSMSSCDPSRLVRLVSGLSLTLDQVASRRPVTLVLLGESLKASIRSQLERQARVLEVGSDEPSEGEIREVLAILLPLDLPTSSNQGRDAMAEIEVVVGTRWSDEHRALAAVARAGPNAVRDALREYLEDGALGVIDRREPM